MAIDDRSPFIGRRCVVFRGKFRGDVGKVVSILTSETDGAPKDALVETDKHPQGIVRTIRAPWSCVRLDKAPK